MLVNERQNEIYKYLQKHGSATVKTLAETFYVSEATLRRDLAEMQRLGLAERSHGGATLPEGAGEISMFVRVEKNAKEKEIAVTNALKSLPNFFAAFIDSSSTALALVPENRLPRQNGGNAFAAGCHRRFAAERRGSHSCGRQSFI